MIVNRYAGTVVETRNISGVPFTMTEYTFPIKFSLNNENNRSYIGSILEDASLNNAHSTDDMMYNNLRTVYLTRTSDSVCSITQDANWNCPLHLFLIGFV